MSKFYCIPLSSSNDKRHLNLHFLLSAQSRFRFDTEEEAFTCAASDQPVRHSALILTCKQSISAFYEKGIKNIPLLAKNITGITYYAADTSRVYSLTLEQVSQLALDDFSVEKIVTMDGVAVRKIAVLPPVLPRPGGGHEAKFAILPMRWMGRKGSDGRLGGQEGRRVAWAARRSASVAPRPVAPELLDAAGAEKWLSQFTRITIEGVTQGHLQFIAVATEEGQCNLYPSTLDIARVGRDELRRMKIISAEDVLSEFTRRCKVLQPAVAAVAPPPALDEFEAVPAGSPSMSSSGSSSSWSAASSSQSGSSSRRPSQSYNSLQEPCREAFWSAVPTVAPKAPEGPKKFGMG